MGLQVVFLLARGKMFCCLAGCQRQKRVSFFAIGGEGGGDVAKVFGELWSGLNAEFGLPFCFALRITVLVLPQSNCSFEVITPTVWTNVQMGRHCRQFHLVFCNAKVCGFLCINLCAKVAENLGPLFTTWEKKAG